MTIDLGKSSGFALATTGTVNSVLSLLGYDPSEWDIVEASYNDVVFHVFTVKSDVDWNAGVSRITDTGGRRKAKYLFPYQDGQVMDDLGRVPETFSFEVLLFGPTYKTGMDKLLRELHKPAPGKLIHPVRGEIRCAMESFELLHASESRNAVALRLTMIESNIGDLSYSRMSQVSNFKSALSDVAKFINKITKIGNKVQASLMFYTAVTQTVKELVDTFNAQFTTALGAVNAVFNANGTSDLANILPNNTQATSVFPGSLSPNDPYANIDLETLSKETATAVVAASLSTVMDQLRQDVNLVMKSISALSTATSALDPTLADLLGRRVTGELIDASQSTVSSPSANVFNTSPGRLSVITDGEGALEFADDIKTLRDSILSLQKAYDLGLQANRTKLVRYVTPRLMSVREVAFAAGVDVSKVSEIDALNPQLSSLNYIEKGTEVLVPV